METTLIEDTTLLAGLGLLMIVTFMTLIMTKKMSAVTALVVVPILFGLIAGTGPGLGKMIVEGVSALAPTALMLVFAVLYFGLMIDAGLFDPLVKFVLKTVGDDPLRVTVGTALLAMTVALDGDGATTALVTISTLLPVYRRLGLNPLILGLLLGLCIAVMNIVPWGGPVARAAGALNVDPSDVFLPMVPAMITGLIGILTLSAWMGLRERKRLGRLELKPLPQDEPDEALLAITGDIEAKRPRLLVFNLVLTLLLMAALFTGIAPLPVVMMTGFAVAMVVNYPSLEAQRKRIAAHASNVAQIILLIFAAGAFTGILSGTGMVQAMAGVLVSALPPELGPFMGPVTALVSLPLTFFMSNDAYYFGILPIIAETASHYGVSAEAVARASLVGLPVHALSPLVAAIYLVCGLLRVEVGEAQRFSLGWAVGCSLLLLTAAVLTGAIPLRVG